MTGGSGALPDGDSVSSVDLRGAGSGELWVGVETTTKSQQDGVEQVVVYSTSTTGLSTLTFRGEVVAGGGGVEERSEVMYCIEGRTYIYYKKA